MENITQLRKEIENYVNIGYTQSETIEQLLSKGFYLNEIKNEIFNYYPKLRKAIF
ncbi:hypothetical protein AAYQ05_18775 [Flavobacterium sp. B11]|uniref:hypothetical protein n=1 Tax=Flavobacterium movens TaxID=214860 RepID=UPI0031DFA997